jgi:hypothetical protein
VDLHRKVVEPASMIQRPFRGILADWSIGGERVTRFLE